MGQANAVGATSIEGSFSSLHDATVCHFHTVIMIYDTSMGTVAIAGSRNRKDTFSGLILLLFSVCLTSLIFQQACNLPKVNF